MKRIVINVIANQTSIRRDGNTTRLIDSCIQELFKGNECEVQFLSNEDKEMFKDKLITRLRFEHHADKNIAKNIKDAWDNERSPFRVIASSAYRSQFNPFADRSKSEVYKLQFNTK